MTDQIYPQEVIDALVRRIFSIQDVTLGTAQQGYISRYRGKLVTEDSAGAYAQLSDGLKPYHLTPLFRIEDGQHVIVLVKELPAPKDGRPMLNLLMFVLTVVSVLFAGGYFNQAEALPSDPIQMSTSETRYPAIGPATPISSKTRLLRGGSFILMNAPIVPSCEYGMGMKNGSDTLTWCARPAK
jgi:hypothetical protein